MSSCKNILILSIILSTSLIFGAERFRAPADIGRGKLGTCAFHTTKIIIKIRPKATNQFATGPTILHRLAERTEMNAGAIAQKYRIIDPDRKTYKAYRAVSKAEESKDPKKIAAARAELNRVSPYHDITFSELQDRAQNLAAMLEDMGFKKGDAVVMNFFNRPEWIHFTMAANLLRGMAGGSPALPPSSSKKYPGALFSFTEMIRNSQAKVIVVQNEKNLKEMFGNELEKMPDTIKKVVLIEGDISSSFSDNVMTYQNALQYGERVRGNVSSATYEDYLEKVDPSDPAYIFTTSGTTGNPKTVVWTHETLIANTDNILNEWPAIDPDDSGRLISFLPLNHIMETIQNLGIGTTTGYTEFFATFPPTLAELLGVDLKMVQPSGGLFVPRLWEAMKEKVVDKVGEAPADWNGNLLGPLARRSYNAARNKLLKLSESKPESQEESILLLLFRWAHKVGMRVNTKRLIGEKITLRDEIEYLVADTIILKKVRAKFGMGDAKVVASGSSYLSRETQEWFRGFGIFILEGYGMTEVGVPLMTKPGIITEGSLGFPVGKVQVRIAGEDGEKEGRLLVRTSATTSLGYLSNDEATAKLIVDGWMDTGDIVRLKHDGSFDMLGRDSEKIKGPGGEFFHTGPIEKKIAALDEVSEVVVVGEYRNYRTALIVLNPTLRARYKDSIEGDIIRNQALEALLKEKIKVLNAEISAEGRIDLTTVTDFRILAGDLEEYKTPGTMKLQRYRIEANDSPFIEIINTMYP